MFHFISTPLATATCKQQKHSTEWTRHDCNRHPNLKNTTKPHIGSSLHYWWQPQNEKLPRSNKKKVQERKREREREREAGRETSKLKANTGLTQPLLTFGRTNTVTADLCLVHLQEFQFINHHHHQNYSFSLDIGHTKRCISDRHWYKRWGERKFGLR